MQGRGKTSTEYNQVYQRGGVTKHVHPDGRAHPRT